MISFIVFYFNLKPKIKTWMKYREKKVFIMIKIMIKINLAISQYLQKFISLL